LVISVPKLFPTNRQISSADGTGATTAHVAQIAWQTKTAPTTRGVYPAVARGVQGEQQLVRDRNPKMCIFENVT